MQSINASPIQQTGEGNTSTPAMTLHQGYDWPLPLMLPDASKGPAAVMQAIDEWFDYHD